MREVTSGQWTVNSLERHGWDFCTYGALLWAKLLQHPTSNAQHPTTQEIPMLWDAGCWALIVGRYINFLFIRSKFVTNERKTLWPTTY